MQAAGHIRVVTWNVRASLGPGEFPATWWRKPDPDRLVAMGGILDELDADLIALQECAVLAVDGVRHDTAGELAALLRLPHRYGAARHFAIAEADGRISGAGLFGNALLSRLPIGPSRTVAMPMAPTTAFVEPPGSDRAHAGVRYADADDGVREPRCLLLADIDGLAVGVTHLSHIGSSERELQAAALDREIGDGPSILLGDLNAPIEAGELAVLCDGWTDAFTVAGVRPGDVRRITTEDGARIDHVLVREMEVTACRRVEEAGWLSDHLPVTADLRRHPSLP